MKRLLIVLMLLPACGCARWLVPVTKVSGTVNGQPFSFSGPKDVSVDSITASVNSNGTTALEIKGLKANMNPAVVTLSGEAFVNGINAVGNQVINGMTTGAKFAAPKP